MRKISKRVLPPNHRHFTPDNENALGFGDIFSDHVFKLDYYDGKWQNPRIEPHTPLSISPAAVALHYGQSIFEGLKCYRWDDGGLALFRAKDNFKRLNRSAEKLCIPSIDEDFALEALRELLIIDERWVPKSRGTSLYIRPFIIGTEAHIGVRPANEYLFMIITGPVGAYYSQGFNPVSIYVEPNLSRAALGGLGDVKAGANYAASLYAAEDAAKRDFSQILWLDPCQHKYIEEVGSMNIFFIIDDEIVTSPLGGTILPGITRDSVITLGKSWGLKVNERPLSIDELIAAQKSNRLKESFGAGTAAVISPVGHFHYKGEDLQVGNGEVGSLTQRFYDDLCGIQYGLIPDPYGWVELIKTA